MNKSFLKKITGLSIFLFLSEATSYTCSSSMFMENEAEICFLPERAKNPKYQEILNLANSFKDFCESQYEERKNSKNLYEENEDSYRYIKEALKTNIEASKMLLNYIKEMDQSKITSFEVLRILLVTRFDLLDQRGKKYLETQEYIHQHRSLPVNYFLPTDSENLSMLSPLDKMLAEEAIKRYQYLNLMIYHLYKLHDPFSLPVKIKQLVSASRILWPILNDETTDLSHPDLAVISYDDEPEDLRGPKDSDYYRSNFQLIKYEIEFMNWGKRKGFLMGTPLEANHPEAIPLPEPEWLYPLPVQDKNTVLGTSKASDRSELLSPVKRERERKKKRGKRPVKALQVMSLKEKDSISQEDLPDLSLIEKYDPGTETEKESSVVHLEEKVVQESQQDSSLFEDLSPSMNIVAGQQKKEQNEEKFSSKEADETGKGTSLRPRGMRLFHPKSNPTRSETESILNKVSKKDSALIDVIFDPGKRGQGFTFGDFKRLWERLNGSGTVRSSGGGGSHYALLNSAGKVISGTYAHGEGQTYTRKTIRYLRDALNTIGANPKE